MRSLIALLIGALAGTVSAWSFAYIHGVFISDIWFSLPALLIAGAICGLCLGWTYGLLFQEPSLRTWLEYNALWVGMFVLIGLVSVVVFKPSMTLAEVMASEALPETLIWQALPVTIGSILIMAAVLSKRFAHTWLQVAAIFSTCTILVVVLGLNVAAMGLIAIPRNSMYMILELAGLILALNGVFALAFAGLGWRLLFHTHSVSARPDGAQR